MSYRVDLSSTAPEILINRINYVFGLSYTTDNISFNARGTVPLTIDEARKYGVESKVAAYYHKGVNGSQEFYLTRGDLNRMLKDAVVEVPIGEVQWSQGLAPYILDELGVYLDPRDIMIEPIPEDAEEYQVRLVPRSLALKGTINIKFVDPTPRRLIELVGTRQLAGFSIPGEVNG